MQSAKAPTPEKAGVNPLLLAQNLEAQGNGKEAVRAYGTLARRERLD